jgi:hypothetical protein
VLSLNLQRGGIPGERRGVHDHVVQREAVTRALELNLLNA